MNERPRRILVVEDDEFIAAMIAAALIRHDYDVRHSSDPYQALDDATWCDLAVLDVGLPGPADGIEVLESIRTIARRDVPAIVATAYSNKEIVQRIKNVGNARYLPKPFVPSELADLVAEILEQKGTSND